MHCLVIGASGYVGGRLVPRLLDEGHAVRVLARDPGRLAAHDWVDRVDVRRGDVADGAVAGSACRDVHAVVYLVHSMDGPGFADRDRLAATALAEAARRNGVRRIVYLGGLQPRGVGTSPHLASRREVGEVLQASGVPTAVVQAGIVVGAGSASFEMIRHLAGMSPVLPMPDHAWNAVQPIGVDDLLHHLVAAVHLPPDVAGAFDVGGADVLTYRDLVVDCAAAAGLPRPVVMPVPLSTPRLGARALAALTPVDRHLAGPLLESMAHDLVCRAEPSPTGPPPGGPMTYAQAVDRALAEPYVNGTALVSEHVERVAAPAAAVWAVLGQLGNGRWFTVPGVWALRGALDRLAGGIGARRTRPARLEPGAALDSWRIEHVEPGRALRLRAETRLPGTARLELCVETAGEGSRYVQRVTFEPDGWLGRAYWFAQKPAHDFVFAVMARTIAGIAAAQA
ncbi:DUF2867 domain-containing protein [Pseudonocardia sp. TRM90224]|uniref:DUF2867 domain-containing protein n=1 Tax=Pseudonocardia sp. TRM90224 TaxID=2812678 RepID=UPI001E2EF768|nr:DUF2867 domain-containing protein [Pseudonocardia sp. TRM90224]